MSAVKAPGFGDRRKAMLEDIAILTGGQVIAEELGIKLENITINDLGNAKPRRASTRTTRPSSRARARRRIIDGRVAPRSATRSRATTSDYDREKLQERLAKLAGGVALVKVGAATESELKEKKARVEDALHATRAAAEEGIVPGGGVALIRVQGTLDGVQADNAEQQAGINIIRRAIEEPLRMIATNAGQEGSIIVEKVRGGKGGFGYNAQAEVFEDLIKAGVTDPRQGRAHGTPERGQRLRIAADDRRHDRRPARGEGRRRCSRGRHGWHGRHGRNGRHDVGSHWGRSAGSGPPARPARTAADSRCLWWTLLTAPGTRSRGRFRFGGRFPDFGL